VFKSGNNEAEETEFWGEKSSEGAVDKWERSYGIHTRRRSVLFVELVEELWRLASCLISAKGTWTDRLSRA
jgi:hypothetical protein